MFMCPVCGYVGLREDPLRETSPTDEICACCGFQFGYTDMALHYTFESWRAKWETGGMKFKYPPVPDDWDPIGQLKNLASG